MLSGQDHSQRREPRQESPAIGAPAALPAGSPRRLRRVHVEITNRCNLACAFCAAASRPARVMAVESFEALMPGLASLADEITLHVLGEPLTHPRLGDILSAAAAAHMPVHVVTNGVLIDASRRDLLLGGGVRQVSISLQSGLTQPAAALDAYLDRVMAFCDAADATRPDLYVNLRLWQAEGPCAGIDPPGLAARLSRHFGRDLRDLRVDVRRRKNVPLRGRQYLHLDSRFVWPSLAVPEIAATGTCHGLSTHCGILADGTVVPCCLDADGVIRLGNALTTPLEAILDGARARRLRDGFAAGRLVEPLCRRCGFIRRFSRRTVS